MFKNSHKGKNIIQKQGLLDLGKHRDQEKATFICFIVKFFQQHLHDQFAQSTLDAESVSRLFDRLLSSRTKKWLVIVVDPWNFGVVLLHCRLV